VFFNIQHAKAITLQQYSDLEGEFAIFVGELLILPLNVGKFPTSPWNAYQFGGRLLSIQELILKLLIGFIIAISEMNNDLV
jgi:hypothetical protein